MGMKPIVSFDDALKEHRKKNAVGGTGLTKNAGIQNRINKTKKAEKPSFEEALWQHRAETGDEADVGSEIDTVNSWIDKYNTATKGIVDYATAIGGRYTSDISGGFGQEIDALVSEYKRNQSIYDNYDLNGAFEYLKALQEKIRAGNEYMQSFGTAKNYYDQQVEYRKISHWLDNPRELDVVEQDMEDVAKELEGLDVGDQYYDLYRKKLDLEEEYKWRKDAQEYEWLNEYGAWSYDALQDEIIRARIDSDSRKEEWLTNYARTAMTTDDIAKKIQQNETQIIFLEAVLKEYEGLAEKITSADDYSAIRRREIYEQYGSGDNIKKKIAEIEKENYDLEKHNRALLALETERQVTSAEDFEENSVYEPTERRERTTAQVLFDDFSTEVWEDQLYEAVNGNEDARAYYSSQAANYYGSDNALGAFYGRSTESKAEIAEMTPDEVKVFNYLHKTQGRGAAHEYYANLEGTLLHRMRLKEQEKNRKYAQENQVHASLAAIVMSPFKGLSFLGQVTDYVDDGIIDEDKPYNKFSYYGSDITNAVSEEIRKSGKWGEVGSYAYNLGMSIGTFLYTTAATGGMSELALGIMGSGAAADMTLSAKERGLNDDQAMSLGVIAGLTEILTEKIGLDALLDTALLKKSARNYIIKNTISEMGEEGLSYLSNTIGDIIVSKDKSQWQLSIDAYVENGCTPEEAFAKALGDQAIALGLDMAAGGISGFAMGSAGVGGNYISNIISGKNAESITTIPQDGNARQSPGAPSINGLQQDMDPVVGIGDVENQQPTVNLDQDSVQAQIERNMNGGQAVQAQPTTVQNVDRVSLENVDITAPVSVAEQIRQQRAAVQQNEGGINNVRTAENADLSQPNTDTGAGVLHGSSQRLDGQSTAEQAGILEKGARQTAAGENAILEQFKQASARQSLAKTLRLPRISTAALGVETGTNTPAVYELPREHWDAGLQNTASRVEQETGKNVRFVVGALQVKGGEVKGIISGNQIIIRSDHLKYTPDQIADHEIFHDKVNRARVDEHTNIVSELREKLLETYTQEQLQKKLEQYAEALEGYLDPNMTSDPAACEEIWERILEELLADAYSGINYRGIGATQYTEDVNRYMDDLGMGKGQNQENGTRQTNAPPVTHERYSADDRSDFSDVVTGQITENWDGSAADTQITTEIENTAEVGSADRKMNNGYIPGVVLESEIESNIKTIAKMESVTTIRGDEFKMGDGKLLVDVTNFFESIGGSIYNNRLGVIYLRKRGVKNDLGHGMSDEKASSFAAIPRVLQYGKVAGYVPNYEGRGYDSATVIAPITIGKEPYMMGVIVHRSNNENRFYVHDVVAIKEEVVPLITGTPKKGKSGGTTSTISIIKKILDVKRENDGKSDIRYSWDGKEDVQETGLTEQATKDLMEAIQSMSGKDIMNDEKLRSIIAQYTQDTTPAPKPQTYKVDRGNLKKAITSELGLTKEQKEQLTGILNQYAEEGKPPKRPAKKKQQDKSVDLDVAVRATKSIRNLKHSLQSMFSIPAGSRAEVNSYIDRFAQRIIANEKVTYEDRQEFFRTMYEAGMMEVEADTIYAEGRSYMTSGRIYVNESLRKSLGDRWNELRSRAFAAGVYLTTDPNNGAGVDVWNQDMAQQVPGLFDENETDMEVALERLIQVAEEGRSEMVSLPEYTAQLARQEHIPVSEILDTMEQQLDYTVRAFAESAGVEIEIKTASERQKAKERQANREAAQRARDARELREAKQKALGALKWLAKNRKKAPRELQGRIDEILGDIDVMAMSAARATNWDMRYGDNWRNLVEMYKHAKENDPNWTPSQHLENMMKRLDGMHLADMTPDVSTIRELYNFAVNLQTEIQNKNKFLNDEKNRQIGELFRAVRKEIQESDIEESDTKLQKLFQEKQLTPMNVLQRMVGWKPDSVFMELAKQLEDGIRDVRRYMVDSKQMLADFIKDHKKWLKNADGQGKNGVWYDVDVQELKSWDFREGAIYGETIKVSMTPLQKIHLYLESQSYANLDHMKYGGRVFADKEIYRKGDRKKAFDKGVTVKLSPETVRKITSDLTEEEMALAKILERYYNQYAPEKINAMSNTIYGYDIATEGFYAPIWVNKDFVQKDVGGSEDGKAISAGSMQPRIKGTNPTYNASCIEVVEKHIQETAYAVGMAIPTENWKKLLNFKPDLTDSGSENLRAIISRDYGRSGVEYIDNLLDQLQSEKKKGASNWFEGTVQKLQSKTIGATFAFNPKIVAKQLGSVPLAAPYLGGKYFPKPKQLLIDRQLINRYSPVLAWRTMGYSMPETKQFKDNPNWTQTNKVYGFLFGGDAITAMDGAAASILWPWAENKVRALYPDLEVGTQAQIDAGESPFYKKVAEEFEYAVARSQSTAEDIYQSELRKEQSALAKTVTMFRSDSAQTYNAFRQKLGEARYYKKRGTKEQRKAANRAVGGVVAATTFNALWSAIVGDLLFDLLKNGAKYWRDDEDELTWASVLSELGWKTFGTFAGVFTGGDLIADAFGALVTGESGWDIEAPGIEQLNNIRKIVEEQGGKLKELFSNVAELSKNGGDVWKYMRDHAGEFVQILYDVSEEIATLCGIPVKNTVDYLIRPIISWIPGAKTALEDLLSQPKKESLAGLSGTALESRVENVLAGRNVDVSQESIEAMSALYTAGMNDAIPSGTPDSVSIKEVDHKLGVHQQQTFDKVWGDIVNGALDEIISSDQFDDASDEDKEKMLKMLYDYASVQAKAVLFPEYEKEPGIVDTESIIKAGVSVSDALLWKSQIADMKQPEKFDALLDRPWSDSEKKVVIGTLMQNELKTESGEPTEYAKFLDLMDEGVSVDQYLQIRLSGVKTDVALEMTDGDLDGYEIVKYAELLGDVELEPGEDAVTNLQKWRICVDFSDDVEDQMTALFAVMSETQYQKVEIARDYGVKPSEYVEFKEALPRYDTDGNGSYKQAEIQAAIDSLGYSTEVNAVLWQLAVGKTTKGKSNPYDTTIGQKVYEARQETPTEADEEETTFADDFSAAIAKQWG